MDRLKKGEVKYELPILSPRSLLILPQSRNLDVRYGPTPQVRAQLTFNQYGDQLQGRCYPWCVPPEDSQGKVRWLISQIQERTVEPRLEHTLRTELQTSSPKSMTRSGAVGQALRRIHKQLQISFITSWACILSRMADHLPPKQLLRCFRSCATRIRTD